MPPRCTIAIVHEQGTEARSEMNTPPSPCSRPFTLVRPPAQGMPFGTRLTPCAPRIRRASQRLLPRPCRSQAPFATSGRFRKPNRPETPRGADVSPGRRSQRRQPPPKTVQKSRTHGEIGDHFLRNRPELAGHKRLLNSDTLFASKTGPPAINSRQARKSSSGVGKSAH